MDALLNLFSGIGNIFTAPFDIFLLVSGTALGVLVGALPGLNSSITMAVLIPITYGMDPGAALCLLAGIYTGSTCGGSISAILLEIPGTGAAVVTAFDGYKMQQRGEGGLALGITAVSSAVGGVIAAVVLCFGAPFIAEQALKFASPEYFALCLMGFASVIGMSTGRISKNIMAILLGLLISIIGISPQGGIKRFTFGFNVLLEGVPLVPMLIGLFGISALLGVIANMKPLQRAGNAAFILKETAKRVRMAYPDKKMICSFLPIWMQSTVVGNIVGAIPGAGMTVAIFMAYDQVKRYRPDLKFGTGVPEGIAAVECANNSVVGSSMIPLLALGVPGNAASALFLGALLIQGLRTGPNFFVHSASVAYTLIAAFLLASILLIPVMHLFVNYCATYVLSLKREVLNGLILILCVTGAFTTGNNYQFIMIAIVFGIIGFILKKYEIPFGPLILSVVLGSMVESYYIGTMVMFRSNIMLIFSRPICDVLLILTVIFLLMPICRALRKRREKA
ncbi:C4-dicarboxylate ABC transporter [Pyramidobacter sp. SM-530-WT-4B]|uniref:C4-dicarboxylate ABC transporter n=1 Tax=Pyramidobacter porci TaxID=2605789 RepID=A0A6L5YD34_9BACT|nr:tripartite tricarboxylate transporter permease [Pyramidobacter porci]MST56256.1 C4-dicarboxylate ABC transporter [Pyramidobacter porci]